ncbi:MAG: RHS repeat-associated core domain-containing protein, partial [Oscillospiraceae bacterium]|nr:RHS repeat-associated core domain-containing protein [Oscillospiraceae bacterium]
YEYDNGGNITDIKAEVDGALIPLEHYEYDEKQGQLKTAIRYENGEEADRWTYSYDTAGNILSEDHEGTVSELHEYAYEDGRWGDLLTSVDGIDLEYDGSGNPTLYANGTELLWNMEWQNGRQLSRATTERDSTTEDVLDFAYDANGIRTSKTVTRNTYRPVQTYKVTFVADGKTVKTMNVTEGYTLKDSDYPAVPEKAGYTGAWQRYPSPVQSNVTVSATYTKITTYYTVTFVADGFTVKTMQVYSGYKLKDSDYPSVPEKLRYEGTWQKYTAAVTSDVTIQATYRRMSPVWVRFYADETLVKTMQVDYGYRLNDLDYPDVPPKTGFTGSWRKYTQRITSDQIIRANYTPIGIIDPVLPSTVDSEPTEEPWEPIEPNPNADPEEEPVAAEPGLSESDWTLASTETVTHEYLMQNGKVARETIRQDVGGTVLSTKTLDFFYDDSGRPFALNYSVDGSDFETYYYILNLQGDVVQIIDANGVMQAEYVYSPWGEIISAEGDLAEINPLRYRGYYYDSETGFYYLRSRYYDPENHRFINADTYASTDSGDAISCNMFAYCGNNPVMRGDENGEIWAWLAGALVGAVSSAISETVHQVAEHFINGTPISVGDILTEAAGGAVYGATVAITGSTTAGNVAKEATTTVIYGIRNHDSFGKIVEDTLWNSAKTAALDGAAGIANKVVSGKYAKLGKAGKLIKAITDDPYVGKYTSSDDQKLSLVIEGAIPNTISDSLGGIYNAVKKRVLNYFRA